MALDPGKVAAARFELREKIGHGGMGTVWRAWDRRLHREVALKQAHPTDEHTLRRLHREAQIVGSIDHPHVVKLFDLEVNADGAWLVMEYVKSRNLSEVISSDGVLGQDEVVRIGQQLADALASVHALDIVHGDVKPSNVLITPDGQAKLTDFGISLAAWSELTVTDTAGFRGTPAYIAPEVARGGQPIPASDVFSLGATLFKAVEGRSPLGDGVPLTQVARSAEGAVDAPTVQGRLGTALSALLTVDPKQRPDAKAVARLLEGEFHSAPVRPVWLRPRVLVGSGVAGLALAATLLAVLLPGGPSAARSRGTSAPTSATAASAMGDPRGADPCALADPTVLASFGQVQISNDYGSFNRCDELIQPKGADQVDVELQLENGPPPQGGPGDQTARVAGIPILREAASSGECDQELTLADKSVVGITAKLDGKGQVDLCAIATAAADRAAHKVSGRTVPRRTIPFPADSLAQLDACKLLDPAALAKVPGVDPAHPQAGFAHWACRWDSPTGGGSVELRFDMNGPLNAADDGKQVTYAGRTAFLNAAEDGNDTCVGRVVHRTYRDQTGQPTVELVYLKVTGSGTATALCDQTGALASDATAKLPKVQ